MDVDGFWMLVDEASGAAEPGETLRESLEALPLTQVAAFNRHFFALLRSSYRWDLWGAAYLMRGGCSDDGFQDFRAELIARGRRVFEAALEDPDTLADHSDVEGDESLTNLASEVYQERSGKELAPAALGRRRPAGKRWDFDDPDEMRVRYPRLFARFGAAPVHERK